MKELEHGKEGRRFNFADQGGEATLPDEVVSLVRRLVNKWGDAPLNKLLDHVYFDTEPMENAKRYELLDFSGLVPSPSVKRPLFNQSKIAELRRAVTSRAKGYNFLGTVSTYPRLTSLARDLGTTSQTDCHYQPAFLFAIRQSNFKWPNLWIELASSAILSTKQDRLLVATIKEIPAYYRGTHTRPPGLPASEAHDN